MNNYQIMINRITDIICNNALNGQNYILIGDNSSGKSEVLHNVVENKLNQAVYFIDSVNRTFDAGKVELISKAYKNVKFDSEYVVSERINPFNFNLQDTFKAATCIEQLYDKYKDRLTLMCKMFLNREFKIVRENLEAGLTENRVLIDGMGVKLSSGYQAVIRIFCEILYFSDVMKDRKWDRGFVVIDEIDEYLSPKYSAQIFNFLQEEFPELDFLITTHSLDLVKSANNANLIILRDATYEIYTVQKMKDVVSADDIFTKLFFEDRMIHKSDDDSIDEMLRRLLNLKVAGLWDENAQDELQKIGSEKMQPHQKMIYKQIEEW